jgi:hypothetical protein
MIEYKAPIPSTGLQINFNEVDLTSSDFTKLNSVPLTIVSGYSGKFLIPIMFQMQFSITTIQPDSVVIANSGAYLGVVNQSSYFLLNDVDFFGVNGNLLFPPSNISLLTPTYYSQYFENTQLNESIVLTAPSDSSTTVISYLKIRTWFYIADSF